MVGYKTVLLERPWPPATPQKWGRASQPAR